MAFKSFGKGKDRGESYPPGFTKRKIILFISRYYPEKVEEKKIRDYLDEEFGISGNTGIKRHLSDLEDKGYLIKEYETGIANYWKINQEYDKFKSLSKIFLNSPDRVKFLESNYVCQMLTNDFLNSQVKKFKKKIKSYEFIQQLFEDYEPMPNLFLDFLTTNPQVFRKSPMGLYYLLNPDELEKEISPLERWYSKSEGKIESLTKIFARQIITEEGFEKFIEIFKTLEEVSRDIRTSFEQMKPKLEEIDESDLE